MHLHLKNNKYGRRRTEYVSMVKGKTEGGTRISGKFLKKTDGAIQVGEMCTSGSMNFRRREHGFQ